MKLYFITLAAIFLFVGCKPKGYFSQQFSNIEEPQTDDERTLVGEFNDYLVLVDSLADIWNGKDTLAMRRLYYMQREQQRRVNQVREYKNIRKSLVDTIEDNMDIIISSIYDKFSQEVCAELYSFYECFDLNERHSIYSILECEPISSVIYTNSYGEHYFLGKVILYIHIGKNAFPEKIESIIKQPLRDNEISLFKEFCKRNDIASNNGNDYMVGDGSPTRYANYSEEDLKRETITVHEELETDWSATEIVWCEECDNKDYSCCPKCKDGEKEDCACGCEGCHDMWEYHNL